ncbi:DNA/RNA helicase domain-containing protein [Leucobacter soli]|uniref:DNA/RNA helicase domain-containing protein n=1 Tax=Leucobacter soli TaxID=2812850 RepID=UPI00361E2049
MYLIDNSTQIYVGETTRARVRLGQHLNNPEKSGLRQVRVIIDEEFNKSACLDLESRLIAWLHADTQFTPINRNDGQQNSNYFERESRYQAIFDEVFDRLRTAGYFSRSVPEIENLNLYKLSPFKALNDEQLVAVDRIVEGLFADLETGTPSTSVVQGGPGTGKTIVAIYLLKLLRDIQTATEDPEPEDDGRFNDYFQSGYREMLSRVNIGFIVPQQSLRKTIGKVFKRTPGLNKVQVLSPYTLAGSEEHWDLLIVDETHRLTHRGSGTTRGIFNQRNSQLFGDQAASRTAVDWVITKSDHQVFLIDGDQSVRPADVPSHVIKGLQRRASDAGRYYSLESQMRVSAGDDYLEFAQRLLTEQPVEAKVPPSYDLAFFDDLGAMRAEVLEKEASHGLSRLVAGYAWQWASKGKSGDEAPHDIELDGVSLRWNRTATDWIASDSSIAEVGSVHTVQGYDLNYAGVIIGPDIVWDEESQTIQAVRKNHFDREVRSTKDEEELLEYVRNAYYVLLTRGMLGTYIYVCDPALRERVRKMIDRTRI